MSSKYRRKQLKRAKKEPQKRGFNDEWDAMLFLADCGIDVEYGGEIYIPHDHLERPTLDAIDYLVFKHDYVPLDAKYRPLGALTSNYLKNGKTTADKPEEDV